MYLFLLFNILTIILQSCSSIHPGDPFPIHRHQSKILTSEDLINDNDIEDPIDDEIPLRSTSLVDSFDSINEEENFIEYVISTSTPTTEVHEIDVGRKNLDKNLLQSTTKSIPFFQSHDNNIDGFRNAAAPLSREKKRMK